MPKFNSFVYDVILAYTPNIIKKECHAYFRLSPEYREKGTHFRFDWIRTGDASDFVAHDASYKEIVGRHYNDLRESALNATCTENNFIQDGDTYKALCCSYTPEDIIIFPSPRGKIEKYHTPPVVSIYPNNSATPTKLVLEINISKSPQRIYLNYEKDLLEINGADSLPCNIGKHLCYIEVTCKKEIDRDIYIYAVSKHAGSAENLIGLIRVCRNNKAYRKSINVLVVNFKLLESEDEDTLPISGNTEIIKKSLNQYLPHALITPFIDEVELDLGFGLEIIKGILKQNGENLIITFEEVETSGEIGRDSILPLDVALGFYINTSRTRLYIMPSLLVSDIVCAC